MYGNVRNIQTLLINNCSCKTEKAAHVWTASPVGRIKHYALIRCLDKRMQCTQPKLPCQLKSLLLPNHSICRQCILRPTTNHLNAVAQILFLFPIH